MLRKSTRLALLNMMAEEVDVLVDAISPDDARRVCDEIETRLRESRILVSVSSPASTLIDASRRGLPNLVRSGVHYFNTESELDALVAEVSATSST